jgi:hypothetical protein
MAKLETGNSKLAQDSQLRPTPNEQPATTNEPGPQAVNRQSPIDNPLPPAPSPQHPAPSTFFLFNPPLELLASLTEEDFRRIFAHSPIRRAKYRGWLRNLCVVMGNSSDARFVPWLKCAREHSDPIVREHAAWALDRLRA